jgi:hypothetical protein
MALVAALLAAVRETITNTDTLRRLHAKPSPFLLGDQAPAAEIVALPPPDEGPG